MINAKTMYGAFEAKAHFGELLKRVENGDRITITKHGRVVAQLLPPATKRKRTLAEIGDRAWESTKGTSLPEGMTIRDLINEGRKY